jgi:AGCS family alanine or glycine:cation symporter
MIEAFFTLLAVIDEFYWRYVGFTLVFFSGLYFTIKTRGYQFITLRHAVTNIKALMHEHDPSDRGAHPIRLYFASVGGMVGIGNMVIAVTAVVIGGPGSLFWLWVSSFAGMLLKYSEIYLGIRYRVENDQGGYDGGPMYYLQAAFGSRYLPVLVCVFMCIYGVEVSQFLILTDTISSTLQLNRFAVIGCLLVMIVYGALGGVKRLSTVCSVLMPPFMLLYIGMCTWVMIENWSVLLALIPVIFNSAFEGHAAIGGFTGSTMLLAAQCGTSRAVYSGDIGIGYDSIIQSETRIKIPERQARVAVFALANDTLICTLSCLTVLVTGLWCTDLDLKSSEYIARALGQYFPHIELFMVVLFFLAGFTTIICYFVVGLKCARYVSPSRGEWMYIAYAILAFTFFSFFDQTSVLLVMNVAAGILTLCNLSGIIKLRHQIKFR